MTNTTLHQTVDVSLPLVKFIQSCHWSDIPEVVRHEGKRSLLNYFSTALSACFDPTIERAAQVYGRFSVGPQATVIGRGQRLDMLTAAALNTMAANVFDFDDTHIPTIIHPTAPVAPAVFALSETQRTSGIDLLLSFILGVEAECRIGNAVSPGHYARGWHITSTCGVFGSALATGKLLGLSAQQLVWALGSASAQSSGLVETLGTMSKSVSMGNAARNGMLSALLAQQDFDGPARPLEGMRGFLNVTADAPDCESIVSELGSRWEILNNTYKPFPCGVVLNPVLEACLGLSTHPELLRQGLGAIERIELIGHPLLRQRTDRPGVATGRESQVSAQHAVAVALTRGKAGLAEFSDQAVADTTLRALGRKISFVDDASFAVEAATVRLHLQRGQTLEVAIDIARGARAKPLSDQDIENKVRTLCEYGGSGCDPEPLIEAVWSIERSVDIGQLMQRVVGRAQS
ncbi:MAG: MmgE/PrpD family protein [Alcaligenaceae bacterium]